jgi:tripartite-type tricarboxylate transporter receptor subunit TctC
MPMNVRLIPLLAAIAALAATPGFSQTFPTRTLHLIVPYPAGGSSDTQARVVAQALSGRVGQPVVVENKPGASAIVGTSYVKGQPADGYTVLLAAPPFVITPRVQANVPYDPEADFVGVSVIARAPMVVAVRSAFPARTFAELVAKAKAEPGKVTYASVGAGGQGQLATELMMQRLGMQLLHVPYKGSAPALVDLAGGHVDVMLTTPLDLASQLQSGLIRVIATGAPQRSPILPDVPTIQESGFSGVDLGYWFSAIVVRAGTPAPIVRRLSSEIAAVMKDPEVRAKLASQSVELIGAPAAESDAFIKAQGARIAEAMRGDAAK